MVGSKQQQTADPAQVAVIGGGIAGMTAALRLAQRGFAVTLYEASSVLGGNLASVPVGGMPRDVYPHMFCDWYLNFWDIVERDLGRPRASQFRSFDGVSLLMRDGRSLAMANPSTVESLIANLFSGVLPPAEMFLSMFALLDLAAEPLGNAELTPLARLDVNGFIYGRPYATNDVARLNNYILSTVWSLDSDMVSAKSYQRFLRRFSSFPTGAPFAWLAKASCADCIIDPWEQRLRELGVTIHVGTKVERLVLADDKPLLTAGGEERSFDNVVLAVPAPRMLDLIMDPAPPSGTQALIDHVPDLARMQTARSAAIPVVDLWLKRKLPGLPAGQVGLHDSKYGLSFCDLSQLWDTDRRMADITVLALAASRGDFIPSRNPETMAFAMLQEAAPYLPGFRPGARWGDPDSDVDWERTAMRTNQDHQLFVNDVGSLAYRPSARQPRLPWLALAGDYVSGAVGMATVESAVESGILAAAAVQAADTERRGHMQGAQIELIAPHRYSETLLLAARLALVPAAYAATAWALLQGASPPLAPVGGGMAERPAQSLAELPLAMAQDLLTGTYALARRLNSEDGAWEAAGAELASYAATLLAKTGASEQGMAGALAELLDAVASRLSGPSDPSDTSYRRWRVKP